MEIYSTIMDKKLKTKAQTNTTVCNVKMIVATELENKKMPSSWLCTMVILCVCVFFFLIDRFCVCFPPLIVKTDEECLKAHRKSKHWGKVSLKNLPQNFPTDLKLSYPHQTWKETICLFSVDWLLISWLTQSTLIKINLQKAPTALLSLYMLEWTHYPPNVKR